jgi:membrane-associated protease RseP (regulator of RpoE activity)
VGWLDEYLAKWKPEELPDLGKLRLDLPPRKRWEPLFEIGFGIAFLIWWAGGFTIPFAPHDADVRITGAQVWATLYWPVVLLVWARIATSLIGFLRPSWKPVRAALILGCTAGTLAVAKVLHEAGQIVTVVGSDTAKAARIQESLDKSLEIAVIVIAAATAFQCAKELYQLYQERR